MKIFVMVDMEGISGICHSSQVKLDGAFYETARKYLVWDTNACVEGCFQGGATKVVVRDAHGGGFNFIWDLLDGRAEYIQGEAYRERMPSIGDFDGLILLGYHAMAGTPQGVLEHTMSSAGWQNFWINGRRSGELAIDAAVAGEHGVPLIMVSGDDKTCREARRFFPGVVAVQVKTGIHIEGAQLLSKDEAHRRIIEGAAAAVRGAPKAKPFRVKSPVTLRLELVSRGRLPVNRTDIRVVDGRTYEVTAPTVEEAMRRL